ncbi:unnamed protein product [Boreogadus saida]
MSEYAVVKRYCRERCATTWATTDDMGAMKSLLGLSADRAHDELWIGLHYGGHKEWCWSQVDKDYYQEGGRKSELIVPQATSELRKSQRGTGDWVQVRGQDPSESWDWRLGPGQGAGPLRDLGLGPGQGAGPLRDLGLGPGQGTGPLRDLGLKTGSRSGPLRDLGLETGSRSGPSGAGTEDCVQVQGQTLRDLAWRRGPGQGQDPQRPGTEDWSRSGPSETWDWRLASVKQRLLRELLDQVEGHAGLLLELTQRH